MADQIMTPVLGKWRAYTDGSLGAGAIALVILQAAQADATLRTHATLAALLAASGNTEASWTTGTAYARKTGIVPAPIPGTAVQDVDIADQVWDNAGVSTTPIALAKIVVCWRPNGTTVADSLWIPLGHADFPEYANGAQITASINATGLLRALG